MASATSTPVTSTSSRRTSTPITSPSGSSPSRITRLQEKEDLRHLNDRLAAYIERVRTLENEKSSMQLRLEEKSEYSSRELGNVRRIYESELADARKTLDNTANERARLQIQYSQLAEENRKLQARYNKKHSELGTATGHCRDLETALHSREAECANLVAENQRQKNDNTELRGQVSSLEEALKETKEQLNAELLQKVDAQNKLQTLQEQLDFQKHINEQEVMELRMHHQSRMVEVDSGRQKEFESKMAEAMQQLRQDHETQIQQYREELERTFAAKSGHYQAVLLDDSLSATEEQEVKVNSSESQVVRPSENQVVRFDAKLENAQQAAVQNSDVASSIRKELTVTLTRLEAQSSDLSLLQRQNTALEARVRELEQALDRERDTWRQRLSRKDQEMGSMREQMQAQLEEYQNLLDLKLSLDMEINTYRKMLEGEEQRLRLSPSPSAHAPMPRRHAHAVRRGKGAKRKRESGQTPTYKVSQQASARGPVSIEEVDKESQYIKLRNNTDVDQALGGWTIIKTEANGPDITFQIPSSYVLMGGHTLTVWAEGVVEQVPPGDLVLMEHRSWGAIDDVKVLLLTPQNEEAAERSLVRVLQQRGEGGDSEEEFDEEAIAYADAHFRRQPKRKKKEKCCLVL